MTEKELRRLKRPDLIEIIYELQKQNKESLDKIESLEQELQERRLKMDKAGSIAEAAVSINGVFEAAQAAANQYLVSVKEDIDGMEQKIFDTKAQCEEMIQNAQLRAEKILEEAKEEAKRIIAGDDESA